MSTPDLYDVVAVNLTTLQVRMLDTGKTLPNAEAYRDMAVMRRGCEEKFFSEVTAGRYKEGDKWGKR